MFSRRDMAGGGGDVEMEWLFVVIHKIAIQIRAFHKECFSFMGPEKKKCMFGKMLLNSL